jgi:hypothetical protein
VTGSECDECTQPQNTYTTCEARRERERERKRNLSKKQKRRREKAKSVVKEQSKKAKINLDAVFVTSKSETKTIFGLRTLDKVTREE